MHIRVLIADDFAAMRRTTRRLLQTHPGIEVVAEADTFSSAMRSINEARPDVALVDLRMPMPTGFEAEHFEGAMARASCRLVTMSIWVDDEASEFSRRLGALARLDKSAMANTLIPTIIRVSSLCIGEQVQTLQRRAACGGD